MRDVPSEYRCHGCDAFGVKLWRPRGMTENTLRCAACTAIREGVDVRSINRFGEMRWRIGDGSIFIGWSVPAIPVMGTARAFWGATAYPDSALEWWRNLPLYLAESATGG